MWYLIESDTYQDTWVKAESEVGAIRIHASYYGDDQEVKVKENMSKRSFDYEHMLDTPRPPYRAIEEYEDRFFMHEKRVNQAGSKGIYQISKKKT